MNQNLITTLSPIAVGIIAGLTALATSYYSRRAIKEVKQNVTELHVLINSNLSKWIEVSVAEALARGTLTGMATERARTEPAPLADPVTAAAIAKGIADGIQAEHERQAMVLPSGPPPDALPK